MNPLLYDISLLTNIVKQSITFKEVSRKLGMRGATNVKRHILKNGIDFSHFRLPSRPKRSVFTRQCEYCDRSFSTALKKKRFCTHSCSRCYVCAKRRGDVPKLSIVTTRRVKSCSFCKKPFKLMHPAHPRRFCSRQCAGAFRTQSILKQYTENTYTGLNADRKFIILRDNNTCTICGCTATYNGLPLTLEMDHIDGNPDNNLASNLRLLCPNCHTQTSTYGVKNNAYRGAVSSRRAKYAKFRRKVLTQIVSSSDYSDNIDYMI